MEQTNEDSSPPPAPVEESLSVVTPLTRESLQGLVGRKRSRVANEDDDNDNNNAAGEKAKRFAPPKKVKAKVDKTLRQTLAPAPPGSSYRPSESYTRVAPARVNYSRSQLSELRHVLSLIDDCITDQSEESFSDLRRSIHTIEVEEQYHNKDLIAASRILEEKGLKLIFEGPSSAVFPWDLKVDAQVIWNNWIAGNLDASMLRGIEIDKKARSIHYKIEASYKDKRVDAHIIGQNGLTNGQWWPMRICAVRDGAHGDFEAGISGQAGRGAFSVVMASGGYADEDDGEIVQYCGTMSETPAPTARTNYLRHTFVHKNPIRVLRSTNKKSKYAPAKGIRYDGLYEITAEEVLDADKAMYRFTLKRLPGQDPIRYQGPEIRPTTNQLAERTKVWDLITA